MKNIYSHSTKVKLFILFLLGISNNLLFAQLPNIGYSPLHSDGSFNSKSIDVNLPVGSTPGSGDAASGAASYSIPIAVPVGTAGVIPSLSLTYNSMGGNGSVGMGWGLSGLSSITRVGKNFFHDGEVRAADFSYQDRFALDGQRLLLKSGNYGENGANYGTENENHSNVTSFQANGDGNVTSFTVQTADGVIMNYGSNDNSRIKDGVNINTISWLLDKVTYPNGNYIEYVYATYDLETVISEIKYTGNSNTGLQPYNTITFEYKNRSDKNIYYNVGVTRKVNVLLDKILITSDGSEFKRYIFIYGLNNNLSYLKEIYETGTYGSPFNSTAFKYGDNPAGFSQSSTNVIAGQEGRFQSGDFNADGISDILFISTQLNGNERQDTGIKIYTRNSGNSEDFTLGYTASLPTNSSTIEKKDYVNNNGLSNMDFNGDGFDDVLSVQYELLTGPSGQNYRAVKTITLFENQKNGTFYPNNLGLPSEKEVSQAGQSIFGGDFNGDGIQDILMATYTTAIRLSGISNSFTNTNSIPGTLNLGYAKTILVFDFNSDGKSDIMAINGNQCEITTLEGNQLTRIYYSNNIFFDTNLFYLGDFNGDGRVDVFSRTSKTDENSDWKIWYSTGKEFVNQGIFNFLRKPLINRTFEHFLIADYNGDGKSDIYSGWYDNSNPINSKLDVYYSKGADAFEFNRQDLPQGQAIGASTSVYTSDYNGDGTSDVISMNFYGNPLKIFKFNSDRRDHLLHKVKNGIGHVTEWQYNRLNDGSGFYNRTNADKTFPLNTLMMPMLAVSSFNVTDGVGGMATKTFNFENAIFHVGGRGLLGFEKTIVSDSRAGVKIISEYEMSNSKYLLLPKKTTTNKIPGNYPLSESTSSLQVIDVGNNRYRVQANSESQINWFERKSSTTNYNYDSYGLVTSSTTRLYGGNMQLLTEETNTSTSYGQHGGRIPNKPTNVSISKTRYERSPNPDASFTSSDTKTMSYDGYGQLSAKTDFAGRPQSVTTYYAYSNVGNITQTTISASGINNRTSSAIYDDKGRFITYTTNVLGQTSISAYDVFGQVTSTTGVDGLSTSFSYDGFGRLTYTTLPTNVLITQQKFWTGAYGAVYGNRILHPGKPNLTTYYDILGREIATETEGYGGKNIITTQSYTDRGQVASSTQPHYPADMGGDAYLTTNNNYDDFNRLTSSTNELGTTYVSYSYNWDGKLTINTTDMGGRNSSKLMDAAGKTIQSTDNGGTQYYSYNAQDKLMSVKNSDGTPLNTSQYDEYGRQIQLYDMSAGNTSYQYNSLGELTSQITPKGQTNMAYDNLGRVTSRSGPEGNTTTEYFGSNGAKTNQVQRVTGFAGEVTEYDYDQYGRLNYTKTRIDNTDYNSYMNYDAYGNMTQKNFPSGLIIKYNYDGNGYLQFIRKNNDEVIFRNDDQSALGQIKAYYLGNNRNSANTFEYGVPKQFYTPDVQHLVLDWNLQKGNLNRRTDYAVVGSRTENFEYDDLDRLTSTRLDNDDNKKIYMGFAPSGNITSKTDVGNYTYDGNKKHSVTSVTNGGGVIPVFTQNIAFSAYERPTSISENGYVLQYTYGADYERIKGVMSQNGNNVYTRYFLGDFERNIQNGTTKDIHYISSPAGLVAIVVRENGNDTYNYTYTDHLGSILTIEKPDGNLIRQSFDAWGRRRDANSWVPIAHTAVTGLPDWLYRGYTGHEHLDQFGLINMNARLYDPVLGRMISPDNFVNGAFGTQGYNRYSYANNNPLTYNDPSGNHPVLIAIGIAILKGAVISAGINATIQVLNNGGFNNFNWGSFGMAALAGGLGGGLSSGIGAAFQSFGSFAGKGLLQAGAHALSGGLQSVIFGGKFEHGAFSGALSSAFGSITAGEDLGLAGSFVFGGTISAIGTGIAGGDPFQAFVTGGAVAAFNHASHNTKQKFPEFKKLWMRFKENLYAEGRKQSSASYARNQCSIRLSRVLMEEGVDMSSYSTKNKTPEGWVRSSKGLADWLENNMETKVEHFDAGTPDQNYEAFWNKYDGKQGIMFLESTNGVSHIDLWNGTSYISGNRYGTGYYPADKIRFWEIKK